ncbi:hypothetical protein P7C70_g3544, partial [Phenoliferia sp. Uapishka_3]
MSELDKVKMEVKTLEHVNVEHCPRQAPEVDDSTLSRMFGNRDYSSFYEEALDKYGAEGEIDPEKERQLRRKIDWIILPLLGICYMFYYVDKTTLGYAAIFGIKKPVTGLGLHGTQYSYATYGLRSDETGCKRLTSTGITNRKFKMHQAKEFALDIKTASWQTYQTVRWKFLMSQPRLKVLTVLALRIVLQRANAARDQIAAATVQDGKGETFPHINETAFLDLTDMENVNFRYVY